MADHDDDWDDWDDDDQDVEPYVPDSGPQDETAPDEPEPTVQMPAAAPPIPDYDDEPAADDDGMLAPPPIDEFANQPAGARSRNRRTRARAVTQTGSQEIDPLPVEEPEDAAATPRHKSGCLGIAVVVLLVAVILAAMGWVLVTMGPLAGLLSDEDDDTPLQLPEPQPTTSAPATTEAPKVESAKAAADKECSSAPQGTVAGNGPGSRDSGTDVILAFDHAYYVDRNGTAARGFMSEEITGTTAESLQKAIDELPENTAHCLKMQEKEDEKDVYLVDLIVFQNDGQELVRTEDEQTIYVEEVDGDYTIIGIINE